MGKRATSAVTINSVMNGIYMLYFNCEQCNNTQKFITTVLRNTVGDVTSVNHYN